MGGIIMQDLLNEIWNALVISFQTAQWERIDRFTLEKGLTAIGLGATSLTMIYFMNAIRLKSFHVTEEDLKHPRTLGLSIMITHTLTLLALLWFLAPGGCVLTDVTEKTNPMRTMEALTALSFASFFSSFLWYGLYHSVEMSMRGGIVSQPFRFLPEVFWLFLITVVLLLLTLIMYNINPAGCG